MDIISKAKDFVGALQEGEIPTFELQVAKIGVLLNFGLGDVVENQLQAAEDKELYWKSIKMAVKIFYGPDYIFTQHGISRALGKILSPDRQQLVVRAVSAFMEILRVEFGVECFFTSGTLLGIIRERKFIAHDDDIDVAYVSRASSHFNWALEWRALVRFINAQNKYKAVPHLPGLLHVTISLPDGTNFRFDLFSSICETNCFVEYPLNTELLKVEDIFPLNAIEFMGVEVPIPANPEKFLWANYGEAWRIPDPTFRFNWKLSERQYSTRLPGMSKSLPSITWLNSQMPVVCGHGLSVKSKDFEKYKISALEFGIEKINSFPRVLIAGVVSEKLIQWCELGQSKGELTFAAFEFFDALDQNFGDLKAGQDPFAKNLFELGKIGHRPLFFNMNETNNVFGQINRAF